VGFFFIGSRSEAGVLFGLQLNGVLMEELDFSYVSTASFQLVVLRGVEFVSQLARHGQELSESGFAGLKDFQDKVTAIVGGKVL
jgi:hypothetical protein